MDPTPYHAARTAWIRPLTAIAVLLSTLLVYRPGGVGIWMQTIFNWLHVPVFGLISLFVLALMPRTLPDCQRTGLAFLGSLLLAVLSEAAQIPISRDASMEDIVANGTGAASFLLVAFGIGRKPAVAAISIVVAAALIVWSAASLIATTQKFAQRDSQFPVIFGGDIESAGAFVSARNVRMETHWDQSLGQMYTRVEIVSGASPRIEFRDLVSGWADYSALSLEIAIEGTKDVGLTLRIHDDAHRRGDQPHEDRFNRSFSQKPGRSKLVIPLRDIETAPVHRTMNMSEIDALILFSTPEAATRVLRLYEIRLN